MKLYYDPRTVNCRKVVAGFKLMGVDFESANVDYFAQGQKEPDYLAINPNGALPALTDGRSHALGVQRDPAVRGRQGRGRVGLSRRSCDTGGRQSLAPLGSERLVPTCYVYLVENVVKPLLESEPDAAVLEAEGANFHNHAAILDARLDGQAWLCGTDNPTIADISVASPMHLHSYQKLPLDPHPNLRAWMGRVEALPCWESTDVAPLLGLA